MRRLVLASALAFALAWLPAARAEVPAPVAQLLKAARIPEDAIGLVVLRGNVTVISHQSERPMQPASTIKVLTTLSALEQLGPAFRGRTELRTVAPVRNGVLEGDLVLKGGADIDLDGAAVQTMLQALRYQGVERIAGRLVLDRQLFNPARPDPNAPPFDDTPEEYYNVIPDALLVNRNMIQLDLRSNGQRLQASMLPALDRVSLESAMTLIDADCAAWEAGWKAPTVARQPDGQLRIVLQGTFPRNCVRSDSINVLDRQDYVDRLVRATWARLGGSIDGETVEGATPPGSRMLAEHVSRALPETIRDTNKISDNALARTLFLTLGSLEYDDWYGSRPLPLSASGETTAARAERTIRNWLGAHGIGDAGLVLENGAGLSRIEKITPMQLALVLKAGLASRWAPEFLSSLPIAALDGTMRRRLKDSPAALRARFKTGGLRNVVALAGYAPDAAGQQCVVVVIINHDRPGGPGRAALDALVDWVTRLPPSPSPSP
jgi:D-alanyl-D-alanine carboxypeptidase/D-alanyl-D-alanine-endopeptidase (penicillin-binding protein 4)